MQETFPIVFSMITAKEELRPKFSMLIAQAFNLQHDTEGFSLENVNDKG